MSKKIIGSFASHFVNPVNPAHLLEARTLKGKTLFVSGASRGIGLAIALRAARDGANIVVAAKTDDPHPKLEGTIHTAASAIKEAGGAALPVKVDIRDEASVVAAVEKAKSHFGGIDILVNNASAISLSRTADTEMKKFDLMHSINCRGTFLCTKVCLPLLRESQQNPHVLNISPPLQMKTQWFKDNVAYTMAKFGMSMCVLGHSEEFRPFNIGVNALWPRTIIGTAALNNLPGGQALAKNSRTPSIMADAAHFILTRKATHCTGNFFVDDEVLVSEGVRDFAPYNTVPGAPLLPDFFV